MQGNDQCIHPLPRGCQIRIWAQPGAKKTELAGLYQGCIKIRLKAPPVDNKANRELVSFLACVLDLKPRQIRLTSGQNSRKKIFQIQMDGQPDMHSVRKVLCP
ncbi:MAG: DUF167 domain-containing protein [Desulfovermiculus sp.]|nr:DUF167 domain-containing protein [Desulfovermiculus sp.]